MSLIVPLTLTLLIVARLARSELADYTGFGVSTGFQSSPVSEYTVGKVATQLNANTFKIYGWPNGPSIAKQIVSQSSTSSKIKLMIELWNINTLSSSAIDNLLSSYSSVRSNIFCICLGNEPLLNSGAMTWSILAERLEFFYQHLRTKSEWSHVTVTIPFHEGIFGSSWPVHESYFASNHKPELIDILNVLKRYDGPFSINLYPFFVLSADPAQLQYALGNERGWGGNKFYDTMLEAKYDAVKYAIQHAIGSNNIEIIVTETGWPSAGSNQFARKDYAEDYIVNTLDAMNNPSSNLYGKKIYIFELFDEDTKGGSSNDFERYFGVYDTRGNSKYNIDLL